MALTEDHVIDKLEIQRLDGYVDEDKKSHPARWVVGVRRADRVLRDGVVVSQQFHRHVVEMTDDLKGEDPAVVEAVKAAKKLPV